MKRTGPILALAVLTACNGDDKPPAPFVVVPPTAVWTALPYGVAGKLSGSFPDGKFSFPECSGRPLPCSVGYVEHGWGPIAGKSKLILNYVIEGNAPTFDWHTNPNNTCEDGAPPSFSLLIHRSGDNLAAKFFRFFSRPQPKLELGTFSFEHSLNAGDWIDAIDGQTAPPIDFNLALSNIASLGLVFGGGCFRSHGVAVTLGSATFTIKSLEAQ